MHDEIKCLLKKARAGDREARSEIVQKNLGLVWNVVRRFNGRGYEADDIFQIGCIGLIKAIDNFDMSFNVCFSTYAVPMIMGEIKRFMRDDGMIKVSRTLKENGWKIKQASEKLSHEYGRNATISEIAQVTELSEEDIVLALDANVEVDSLYKNVYRDDGREVMLVDQLVAKETACDLEKEKVINHILIDNLIKKLKGREKKLIEYRYFKEMTQTQIADKLGISQVQVSRLEKKILKKMYMELNS
ncbi:rNA polymerase sigma factor [Clostridium sp. CAG:253]|jgi:RNA polymerase sporulation-specific sigma factor|nr:rNA polymerase sigma factor [Clostridium sp. CAG:253]